MAKWQACTRWNGGWNVESAGKRGDECGVFPLPWKGDMPSFARWTGGYFTAPPKNKFGKIAYYFTGIKELKTAKKFPVTLKSENLQFTTDAILCLIANSRYVSGFKIDNEANCHDGYVNLIIFKEKKPKKVSFKTLITICKLFLGGLAKIRKVKDCHIIKLNKFSIELYDKTPVNIDGEIGHKGSFDFEMLNEHIDIIVK